MQHYAATFLYTGNHHQCLRSASVARGIQLTTREFSDPYGLRVAQLSGSRVVPGDALVRSYVEMPQSRYATSLDVKAMLWSLS